MLFRLKQSQIKQLKDEAYLSNPIEACALLFGKISKTAYLVKKIVVAKNILNSTVEFAINPQFIVVELKKAETEGLDLVGFFHSHPARAYPSTVDLENMKFWTKPVWLIFSLTENEIAAYMLRNNLLEKIELKIEA